VSRIESIYAFDIHCNGFFPVLVYSYLLQVCAYIRAHPNPVIVDLVASLMVRWTDFEDPRELASLHLPLLLLLHHLQRLCRYEFFLMTTIVLPFLRKQEYFQLPILLAGLWFLGLTAFGYNSTHIFIEYLVY
jgi:hypothetical protein